MLNFLSTFLLLGLASAMPQREQKAEIAIGLQEGDWVAGGPGDGKSHEIWLISMPILIVWSTIARGPCPMMNTLANHGFLPRNGLNITRENAVHALTTGINFNDTLANIMWEQALVANPEANATFFTLYAHVLCKACPFQSSSQN